MALASLTTARKPTTSCFMTVSGIGYEQSGVGQLSDEVRRFQSHQNGVQVEQTFAASAHKREMVPLGIRHEGRPRQIGPH